MIVLFTEMGFCVCVCVCVGVCVFVCLCVCNLPDKAPIRISMQNNDINE